MPVDGRREDMSTLIRWDDLTRNADIIPAKHILFVMDACYSGLALQRTPSVGEQRFVSDMLKRFSRQVIAAGKADQPVADGGGPTGKNSLFTGYLLEGMRGKATNKGVLTASYLMNYVYQMVASDERSNQTPHFGHIEGDGDFILTTPHNEHLTGNATGNISVIVVKDRPDAKSSDAPSSIVGPSFAEKSGYLDPESDSFGQNEWTAKLEGHLWKPSPGALDQTWAGRLSLVIEPISGQSVTLDLLKLAQELPNSRWPRPDSYGAFIMPARAITTSKSVVLYQSSEPYYSETMEGKVWSSFFRIERNGAIEYSDSTSTTRTYTRDDGAMMKAFRYVPIVARVWSFLREAHQILNEAGYQSEVRYLVNLVSTNDTLLVDFAKRPGVDGQRWSQTFEFDGVFAGSLSKWKCHDVNIQIPFRIDLGSLNDISMKKLVVECAEGLGLAYNHQSKPRCFPPGTDDIPWEEVR